MPSPADIRNPAGADPESTAGQTRSVRGLIEGTLHALAVLLLAFLIWQALYLLREPLAARTSGSGVRAALESWSTREAPARAHVAFDSAPAAEVRDWLAALPGAGTAVSWEGPALTPSAVTVEPVADPTRPTRIWLAAPAGSGVVLRDGLGALDSVTPRGAGAVLTAEHIEGVVRTAVGGTVASAAARDSLILKRVLLLGIASWEAKFLLAALEEQGWSVDARFDLSPFAQGVVRQGPVALRIDTADYSVVIAVDTAAVRHAAAIARYVRSGGGFIATGHGATLPAFAALLPGSAGPATQDAEFEADTAQPRKALALMPIVGIKPGAVALEQRDGTTAVAAQRVGQGRVLQVGYLDTWRWRLGGLDQPVPLHRAWWARMVSSVAYAPRQPRPMPAAAVDPTPVVTLVSTLGAPRRVAAGASSLLSDPRLIPALFAFLMAALFTEWASRRLRGRS